MYYITMPTTIKSRVINLAASFLKHTLYIYFLSLVQSIDSIILVFILLAFSFTLCTLLTTLSVRRRKGFSAFCYGLEHAGVMPCYLLI